MWIESPAMPVPSECAGIGRNHNTMQKIYSLTLAAMLAVAGTLQAQNVTSWPDAPATAKAGTRWWLMGSALEQTSVEHRLNDYATAGIGAVEMTPIYGVQSNEKNELSFLSSSWMDALKYTRTAADKEGVILDMNTGTGWPFGGPSVTINEAAGKLEYVSKTVTSNGVDPITCDISISKANTPKLNKVMAFPQGSNTAEVMDLTASVQGEKVEGAVCPAGDWLVIAIYNSHTLQKVKRAAPGGEGYVLDHFDSTAVANYLKKFETAFETSGAAYPRAFFNDSYEVYYADWTPKIFEEFYKYRGYRLEEHIDKMLGEGTRKDTDGQVLADYRETLHDMLLNNFTRQWTAWAHQHGALTRNQAHGSPGNLIDFYAAVDIPEIEGFGLTDFGIKGLRTDAGFTRANYSDFSTLKYASSAAHVAGKPLTSSETFTWLTEHFRTSLSQMKPDLDLMFVAGVNHVFFHGTTYTPDNVAWPGWKFYAAIDMSPTNTIWHDAPELMNYIERCQTFLQMGKPDNDVLVYVPFRNAWHKNSGTLFSNRLLTFPIDNIVNKLPEFATCVNNIEKAGLDCDYISEALLLGCKVENGQIVTAAGTAYKALVVPIDKHLSTALVAHLESMKSQGATIVYGNDAATIAQITAATPEALRTQLGLRMIRRSNDGGHHYFISNLQDHDVCDYVPLTVDFAAITLYNPLTGKISRPVMKGNEVLINLRSGQSVILQTHRAVPADYDQLAAEAVPVKMRAIELTQPWTLSFDASATPLITKTYKLQQLQSWETLDEQTAQLAGTGIYTTTFCVGEAQMAQAEGGWLLDLGDVRESARVYVNDQYVGCAWCAPFQLEIGSAVKAGENTLRIEVTNLPANRIRQMDIDGTQWRIFKDVNILDINNGNIGVSGITSYADWSVMPSGLNSAVYLIPLQQSKMPLQASLERMVVADEEGRTYYPIYRLHTPEGQSIDDVSLASWSEPCKMIATEVHNGEVRVVVGDALKDDVVVTVKGADGYEASVALPAYGPYRLENMIDFTSDQEPGGGWSNAVSNALPGFSGKADRRVAKSQGKEVTALYDGLTFTAGKTNVFYYYPGYGMSMSADAVLTFDAQWGDAAILSYVQGDAAASVVYNKADSVTTGMVIGRSDGQAIIPMSGKASNLLYLSLLHFQPIVTPTAIEGVEIKETAGQHRDSSNTYYNLQGMRVAVPTKGIYLHRGKKVIIR